MARVALLCADLLFGSRVEGGLGAAGHQVTRFATSAEVKPALAGSDLLVVDLTDAELGGPALVEEVKRTPQLDGLPTLGFYSHVDQETRREADNAGFDLVVPRSRMAREMAQLADRLLAA